MVGRWWSLFHNNNHRCETWISLIWVSLIRLSFHMRDYEKDGPRVGEQRSLCKFPEARHNSSTHPSLPPLWSPGTYRKLVWCWRWGWRRRWGWQRRWGWRCLKFVEENGSHHAALQIVQWVSVHYGVKERGTLGVAIERPTVDSIFMAEGFSRLLRNTFKGSNGGLGNFFSSCVVMSVFVIANSSWYHRCGMICKHEHAGKSVGFQQDWTLMNDSRPLACDYEL